MMRSCQCDGLDVEKAGLAHTFEFLFRYKKVWINSRPLLLLVDKDIKIIYDGDMICILIGSF